MSTQMQTCSVCGSQVPVGSRFCQNCGHAMTQAESPTARVENITPPQGSPTMSVGQQYTPGSTQYPPQAPTLSWQPGQQGEAPRQPQYAQPPTEAFTPPPANLYAEPPTYQQMALQPANAGYTPQPYPNAPLNPTPGQGFSLAGISAGLGRDPSVAFLLELLGYIPSLPLGIGHMYAGRIGRGVALMLGWWIYGGTVLFLLLTIVGVPIACLMLLLWPVMPLISGFWIKRDLETERARLGTRI